MKEFWEQLKPRERTMLMIGGGFLLLLIFYFLAVKPVFDRADELEQSVATQRETLTWMKQSAQEIKMLSNARRISPGSGGQSLLSIVDSTASSSMLTEAMKRVEPEGANRVRVWMEHAAFDDVTTWLERLQRDYNVKIESVVIDRDANPGRVNARLVFEGAGT